MFRHRPVLAAELLTVAFGVSLPAYEQARLGSGELTPIEHRADTVVELRTGEDPVLAVVVEIQLSRDPAKRFSWPVYLATVRARLRCPTALLVICPDAATAAWCAKTVHLGPGNTFTPTVLGPRQIPLMTDPDHAAHNPEMAVLSAMAHGGSADQDKVLHTLPAALVAVDDQHAKLYYDLVLAALPTAARRHLEELMSTTYQYQSDFARKYVAEGEATGRAEGEATALLTVLAARGIHVPGDARTRITECTDLDQLTTWVCRAATADSIHDVLR